MSSHFHIQLPVTITQTHLQILFARSLKQTYYLLWKIVYERHLQLENSTRIFGFINDRFCTPYPKKWILSFYLLLLRNLFCCLESQTSNFVQKYKASTCATFSTGSQFISLYLSQVYFALVWIAQSPSTLKFFTIFFHFIVRKKCKVFNLIFYKIVFHIWNKFQKPVCRSPNCSP